MRLTLFLLAFCAIQSIAQEPYESNQTYTYEELHQTYLGMQKANPQYCKLIQFGSSDYGKNIELFLINKDGKYDPEHWKDKTVLMINNAIHPGEPCGVDACVELCKTMLSDSDKIPDNVVIGIIPMYNVGGGHNRNCCSRANQNGPEEYGFRGNAKNLDLNRDFVKADSRNTRTFYKIFNFLNPNIFVDTHTSNGADYQHIMTLITSQTDKMHPYIRDYTKDSLNPYLFASMKTSGYDMVPYVHTFEETPEGGIYDYLETPRYSTGYTNLFNTISFVTETHMLKTFEQRVVSTRDFLQNLIFYMQNNNEELIALKQKADYNTGFMEYMPINWELDTNRYDMINFKGYEAEHPKSEVTGLPRLKYNHEKPWEKEIRYYNRYVVTDSVKRPEYYVIPQAWKKVVARLQLAGIEIWQLTDDVVIDCEMYFVDDHRTRNNPYEGHYLHQDIKVTKADKQQTFYAGDYVVPTRNEPAQFIVQTLEPHAPDSYFAWNFFDAILQQKEWFSSYVFEETALEMLSEDAVLKAEFEKKKREDEEFANSGFAQLYWLYRKSPNYERTHNLYPVARYNGEFMNDQLIEGKVLLAD